MAILHRPALIISDEQTSALDTITQSEILKLFAQLNREPGIAILTFRTIFCPSPRYATA